MPAADPPRSENFPPPVRVGRVVVEVAEDFFGRGPGVRIRIFAPGADSPTEVFLGPAEAHRLAGFLMGFCRAIAVRG